MLHSYEILLEVKKYSDNSIQNASLIVHPKVLEQYGLVQSQVRHIFEVGSNFTQLLHPIIDEFGNEFWDSEGYYMAQRINDKEIKKLIAFCSLGKSLSKKSAYLHKDELDDNPYNRIDFMRNAIRKKFDNNSEFRELLLQTGSLEIIEYTYWGDEFFGIDCNSREGANILGKLLMEYRDNILHNF